MQTGTITCARAAHHILVADKWVDTNGTAAKVMTFDRLGEKVRPGTFGKINVG